MLRFTKAVEPIDFDLINDVVLYGFVYFKLYCQKSNYLK